MAQALNRVENNDILLGPYEHNHGRVSEPSRDNFDDEEFPNHQKSRPCIPRLRWWREALALILSIGSNAVLFTILLKMWNQPLSNWNSKISLNAVISVITTTSRILLLYPVEAAISQLKWLHFQQPQRAFDFELFDRATRGPSGASQLFLRYPLHIASIGCLVVVLASLMSHFIQQIVYFETRAVISHNNSSASLGYSYEYFTNASNGYGGTGIDPTKIDFALRGAVLKGIYDFSPSPDFDCPGTCEWNQTWMTLGFAHECQDVTKESLSSRLCWDQDQSQKEVEPWNTNSISFVCSFTTPGNITLRHGFTATGTVDTMNISSINHVGDDKLASLDPSFLTTAQYRVNPDYLKSKDSKIVENVTECNFFVTAWQMSGASSTGQTFQSINQTRIPLSPQPFVKQYFDDQMVIWNQTNLPEPFKLGSWEWRNLATMMSDAFNYTARVGDWGTTDFLKTSPLAVGSASGSDLNVIADQVAAALTDAVRAGPRKRLFQGNYVEQVIFVQVRWQWYILPVVAEAAAVILLVYMVWSAKRHIEMPLWKKSALATLFHQVHSVDDAPGTYVVRPQYIDAQDLERWGKKSSMSLEYATGSPSSV